MRMKGNDARARQRPWCGGSSRERWAAGERSIIAGTGAALPFAVQGFGELKEDASVLGEGQGVVGAEGDDEVVAGARREIALREAESLADEAFEAVAGHRVADGAADGEAQARVGEVAGACGERDRAGA